jgi:uncharacterized protein YdeI (YjbR/CyaY-like superfamily)
MSQKTATGPLHKMPADLREALSSSPAARAAWEDITPLARNEWICWVTYVKKPETRREHVERALEDLSKGKRRPCCWPGCPHRNPNAAKYFRKK